VHGCWDTLCKAASFGGANDKRRENYALGVWLSASPVISLSLLLFATNRPSSVPALSLERLARRALQFAAQPLCLAIKLTTPRALMQVGL
jgi:hypothetical protein